MMIEINYLAVGVCAVLGMALGYLWYGPLFGRKWMEIIGANPDDMARRAEMQKAVGPLYVVQFFLTFFQAWVIAHYIAGWNEVSGVENALWIWAGFVMPVVAGTAMWNNDSKRIAWARFLTQGGYQLALFVMFGLILQYWK